MPSRSTADAVGAGGGGPPLRGHKPRGFVSSSQDERGRRSVVRLLDQVPEAAGARLWPAGRLDVESEGLMVLTNDGAWANRLLHPRYGMEREYAVLVEWPPHPDQLVALLDGVMLEDGLARLLTARLAAPPREVSREPAETGTWLRVRVGEGRKREVRRMFSAVRMRVLRLVRVRLGPLTVKGLRDGQWRALSEGEVAALIGQAPGPRRERPPRTRSDERSARERPRRSGPARDAGSPLPSTGRRDRARARSGTRWRSGIGATFVDTGLMYRALTLAALQRGIRDRTTRQRSGAGARGQDRGEDGRSPSRPIGARRCCSTGTT